MVKLHVSTNQSFQKSHLPSFKGDNSLPHWCSIWVNTSAHPCRSKQIQTKHNPVAAGSQSSQHPASDYTGHSQLEGVSYSWKSGYCCDSSRALSSPGPPISGN